MDLSSIFNGAFQGLNVWQIVAGLFAGALIKNLIDEVILQILAKYFPDKYLEKLYSWVEEYDEKYLDTFKAKYPKSGKRLELKIAGVLDHLKKIILDE